VIECIPDYSNVHMFFRLYFQIHSVFCGKFEMCLSLFYLVPGPSKITNRRNSVAKKKPYELDNGLVPLPVKVCFECRK
jgi:hypothetical protein